MPNRHDRMRSLSQWVIPREWRQIPEDQLDPALRHAINKNYQSTVANLAAQKSNGAPFAINEELRHFSAEYSNRAMKYGLRTMPQSFNLIEAFTEYHPAEIAFFLRREVEHSFSLSAFLDYVTAPGIKLEKKLTEEFLDEGVIYNFSNIDAENDIELFIEGGVLFYISGFSLVRHGTEVSLLSVLGIKADLSVESKRLAEKNMFVSARIAPDKQQIFEDSQSQPSSAVPLVKGLAYWKCAAAVRYDLLGNTTQARAFLQDCESAYITITDDLDGFIGSDGKWLSESAQKTYENMLPQVQKYASVFDLCSMFLMIGQYFASVEADTHLTEVPTELKAIASTVKGERLKSRVGKDYWITRRTIREAPPFAALDGKTKKIGAPDFHVETKAFWKKLAPDEVGTDRRGNPISGRTWVTVHESWQQMPSPQAMRARQAKAKVYRNSPAAGFIYVLRSANHSVDTYKVGLTQRTVEERAKELSSSTASIDGFGIMRRWETADCIAAEKEIHKRLALHRLNPKREFFSASIEMISAVVDAVVSDIDSAYLMQLSEEDA